MANENPRHRTPLRGAEPFAAHLVCGVNALSPRQLVLIRKGASPRSISPALSLNFPILAKRPR